MACAAARAIAACGSEGHRGACGRQDRVDGTFGWLEGGRGAFVRHQEERAPVAIAMPSAVVASAAVFVSGASLVLILDKTCISRISAC